MVHNVKPDISLVIPAYNPQERSFVRVLTAAGTLLSQPGIKTECVIVDNRLTAPLQDMRCVQEFLREHANARVVREESQGLTFARLAGFRATSGDVVVVFDDDNVPYPSYLRVVKDLMQQYPFVGVWGPGNVDVDCSTRCPLDCNSVSRPIMGRRPPARCSMAPFPQRGFRSTPSAWGRSFEEPSPTTIAVGVESGRLSATDRRGTSLASAGDGQIVWEAINMGLAAGMHPDLKTVHLIPGSRATVKYLRRLMFGCSISHYRARRNRSRRRRRHGDESP